MHSTVDTDYSDDERQAMRFMKSQSTKSKVEQIDDLRKQVEELRTEVEKDDIWKTESSPFATSAMRARKVAEKVADEATDGEDDESEKAQWAGSASPFALGGN